MHSWRTPTRSWRWYIAAVTAVAATATLASPSGAQTDADRSQVGEFSAPFVEPTIDGQETQEVCVAGEDGQLHCKPTAGSMSVLTNGEVLYFNALEGTENVEFGIAAEFGRVSIDDQSRALELDLDDPQSSAWHVPAPNRADVGGDDSQPLFPAPLSDADSEETAHNDEALFCSDLVLLSDGRLLAVGGTDYYTDPNVPGTPYGVVELEGTEQTRIYDPATRSWEASGSMHHGRWYPSLVTLADGDLFVASGVTKLIKPLYTDAPDRSGSNVTQTETYDVEAGTWTENGADGERSLPLYPRLHLLPNGDVYYDAAGQVFNPSGQSYDEALWNIAATYDPDTRSWTDVGVPGLGTTLPGFRGSSFSIMLPLEPDDQGAYDTAEFLAAGGIAGTTPGTYIAQDQSAITTVEVDDEGVTGFSTRETGPFNTQRWYSTGVVLPDGSVMAFSGADRDEVVAPGTGFPVTTAERFDPATETWQPMATSGEERTYHSTALLLGDGRVLVGGHSPISTLYGNNTTLPGGFTPQETRNPTFEIYSPPYVFHDDRPEITKAPQVLEPGSTFRVKVDGDLPLDSLLLVRNTAITHLIDGDQRAVELDIVGTADGRSGFVDVRVPDNAVVPAGPYHLFARGLDGDELIPSTGWQLAVAQAPSGGQAAG
jgi:hypothetical protein